MKITLSFFKSKPNYVNRVTYDPIVNITGLAGSGKTTFANTYRENERALIVSIDTLFGNSWNETSYSIELKQMLIEKYESLREEDFNLYYSDIIHYFLTNYPDYQLILEGPQIYQELMPLNLKGTVIIIRVSGWEALKRVIKRDLEKHKKNLQQGKITKKEYYKIRNRIIKTRFQQLKYRKRLNHFLEKLSAL